MRIYTDKFRNIFKHSLVHQPNERLRLIPPVHFLYNFFFHRRNYKNIVKFPSFSRFLFIFWVAEFQNIILAWNYATPDMRMFVELVENQTFYCLNQSVPLNRIIYFYRSFTSLNLIFRSYFFDIVFQFLIRLRSCFFSLHFFCSVIFCAATTVWLKRIAYSTHRNTFNRMCATLRGFGKKPDSYLRSQRSGTAAKSSESDQFEYSTQQRSNGT